jgi:hypothetical protein
MSDTFIWDVVELLAASLHRSPPLWPEAGDDRSSRARPPCRNALEGLRGPRRISPLRERDCTRRLQACGFYERAAGALMTAN